MVTSFELRFSILSGTGITNVVGGTPDVAESLAGTPVPTGAPRGDAQAARQSAAPHRATMRGADRELGRKADMMKAGIWKPEAERRVGKNEH